MNNKIIKYDSIVVKEFAMSQFPTGYKPILDQKRTEHGIKFVKDTFQRELSGELKLSRVTSPLFVARGSGINDDLSGVERPVHFEVGNMGNRKMEIVQSLAKWKRLALANYGYEPGTGLYTDMNAIRPDDDIDRIHSLYVDQWDWERVMDVSEVNICFLKEIVTKIYEAIKRTQFLVQENFSGLSYKLPEKITFIHSEDALLQYPDLSPKEREYALAKKYGAIFIIGIGAVLASGEPHGQRAPDYDDWSTVYSENSKTYTGLNGDIIVWDEVLGDALELSSMGIRVTPKALMKQLEISGKIDRKDLYWHKRLLAGEYPQTIGGGIGQSRLCMFMLEKAHIGEVQASVWPDEFYTEARKHGCILM